MANEPEFYEYRLELRKYWESRFISHLDVMRTLARGLRRADLPIYFSQGFNPKPRISYLTPPLSVGFTSECEAIDVRLEQNLPADDVQDALEGAMPPGLRVTQTMVSPPGTYKISWIDYLVLMSEDVPGRNPEEYFPAPEDEARELTVRRAPINDAREYHLSAVPDFDAAAFFNTAFLLRSPHGQAGGSPLKVLSTRLAEMSVPHHIHRAGAG